MSDLVERLKHAEQNCDDKYLAEVCHNAWKRIAELEIEKNEAELLEEDIELVHLWLDDRGAPRFSEDDMQYSIIGRIKRMQPTQEKDNE